LASETSSLKTASSSGESDANLTFWGHPPIPPAGRILRVAGADADHPIHPALPETAYLKTLTLALD
jgi:hypothetical protein